MNKATPAPESAEPLKYAALLNRLFEMTKAPYYATACDTLVLAEMAIVGLERENAALRAEFERLADQAEPAPAPFAKDSWQHAVDNHLSALGKTSEEFPNPHEAVRWLLEFTSTLPVDAPAPVGEHPALPEPSSTAYIQGHSGGEYRTLSDSYEPDCAMFSPQQMHAYIDADRAQRPDREVRLLTSKDIDDVRKTLWRDAQMNLSDLHAEDAAKAFQCKFCEVNGLTVKDQS